MITVSSIDDGKLLGETTQGLPVVVKKLTKEFTANIDDHLEVYFLTYDKKMNMLSMSITEPKQRSGSYSRTQDKESSATFGDLMKKQLEDK